MNEAANQQLGFRVINVLRNIAKLDGDAAALDAASALLVAVTSIIGHVGGAERLIGELDAIAQLWEIHGDDPELAPRTPEVRTVN